MKNLLPSLLFALVTIYKPANAQTDICACASYTSLQFRDDYETLFPPDTIKKQKIRQAVVYTAGCWNSDSCRFVKYVEMKFNFDMDGYVSSIIQHYAGTPNHIYEFERNELKQITKKTFIYLDSLGQKMPNFLMQVTDYKYDAQHRLIETRNRDFKGNIVPGKHATYTRYSYNKQGEKSLVKTHVYFENIPNSTYTSTTTFNYSKDRLLVVSKTRSKSYGKSFTSDSLVYDKNGNLLSEKMHYSPTLLAFARKQTFTAQGKLAVMEMQIGEGAYNECPEKTKYTENYTYTSEGLPGEIDHLYNNATCLMSFEYLR